MLARIQPRTKSAMQAGKATARGWELVFEPADARAPDPLMGWTVTADTEGQVRLAFATAEDAIAYARRQGLAFELASEEKPRRIIKAYADNFAYNRKIPWTH